MSSKNLLTAVTMTAAALFFSCTDEEFVGADSLRYQAIQAEIADPSEAQQSRSCVDVKNPSTSFIGLLWQPADKIGVFSQDGTTGNYQFTNTATENVPQTEFGGEMSGDPYYAYYPYSAENDGAKITELKGTLPAEQAFDPESGTLVGDYKYGTRVADGSNKFTFTQLFTMLRITLDATETALEGERLNQIKMTVTDSEGNARPICGNFTFNAITGDWNAVSNTTSGSISMPWTTRPELTKGKTYLGFITVMPVVKTGDKLSIEVVTEGHKASFTADCKLDFKSGYVYNIPLKLKEFAANDKFNYIEEVIEQPSLTSFTLEVAKNEGKLLNNKLVWNSSNHTPSFSSVTSHTATINDDTNEITLTIPYLYDFKLKPTFAVSASNSQVLVNGVEQESGTTEVDFTKPVTYTVVTSSGASRDYTVKITNTGLPVVVVKQSGSGDFSKKYKGGVNIGSANIGGTLLNQFVNFMVRGKDTEWEEDDQITIYKADGTVDCSALGGVRLRGNTTQTYPKKPLAIKFLDKQSVLGMPKHKRWVLLANQLDRSMIRNAVALDIAHVFEYAWRQNSTIQPGIPWCPSGQNVELVISDKDGNYHHVGNYFLAEQIKIDENRLNIKEPLDIEKESGASDFTQYGYLIEAVNEDKRDETSYFKSSNGIYFQFKDELNSTLLNAVKEKIQQVEDNIDNGDYTAAYENLDIHSMIDQMLIWELTLNREYGDPSSVYMYMDGDGKLSAGPVWDFDRGTFQNQELAASGSNANTKRIKNDSDWMYWRKSSDEPYIWYPQLVTNDTFQQTVKERWAVIYPYLKDMIENRIRTYGESLKTSWECNSAMWPANRAAIRSFKSDFTDWSGDEEISDWNELISNFVTVYKERLAGMNTLITSGQFTKQ